MALSTGDMTPGLLNRGGCHGVVANVAVHIRERIHVFVHRERRAPVRTFFANHRIFVRAGCSGAAAAAPAVAPATICPQGGCAVPPAKLPEPPKPKK